MLMFTLKRWQWKLGYKICRFLKTLKFKYEMFFLVMRFTRRNKQEWPTKEAREHGRILKDWEYLGYRCLVLRGSMSLNGYVRVPPKHRASKLGFEEVEEVINVHGGITFHCIDLHGYTWLGFDCGHYGDVLQPDESLGISEQMIVLMNSVGSQIETKEWLVDDVAAEVEQMAIQLNTM